MERTRMICLGILLVLALTAGNCLAQDIVPLGRSFNFWNGAADVVINNDYAFIACGSSGIQVVNIRDPYELGVVSVFDNLSGKANRLEKTNGRLYVQVDHGVDLFDLRNQPRLSQLCYIDAGDDLFDMSGSPNYLAISSYTQDEHWQYHCKVVAYDVNDPDNPVVLDTLTFDSPRLRHVLMRGTKVFVEADTSIVIYEISDNFEVERQGEIPLSHGFYGFDGRSDYIVLGYQRSFEVWEVANPDRPRMMSETRHPAYGMSGLRVNYPYLTIWGNGDMAYQIYNISNPNNIAPIGQGSHHSMARAVSDGNYCYIVNGYDRLYSMTTDGGLATLFQMRGFITDIEFAGDKAFSSLQSSGFAIVDIRQPEQPEVTHTEALDGWTNSVSIVDTIAFTSGRGFHIFDCANPRVLELGSYVAELNAPVAQAIIDGETAYLLIDNWDNPQLDILDISDLHSPGRIAKLHLSLQDGRMAYNREEKYLYIAGSCSDWNRSDNFEVIDVSVPDRPYLVSGFRLAFNNSYVLNDIAYKDDILALSLENVGAILYETSNPAYPNFVGDCSPDEGGYGAIALHADHLFAASESDGLTIYDINTPELTHPVGNIKDFIMSNRIVIRDDGLVALSTGSSLRFYDVQDVLGTNYTSPILPTSDELLSAYPNPFNGSTTIKVNLPSNAPTQLLLFDLTGRPFGEWNLSAQLPQNQSRIILDGNGLPSGSFYLQASTGSRSQSIPIIHLK